MSCLTLLPSLLQEKQTQGQLVVTHRLPSASIRLDEANQEIVWEKHSLRNSHGSLRLDLPKLGSCQ
jgi:hypothetical protein